MTTPPPFGHSERPRAEADHRLPHVGNPTPIRNESSEKPSEGPTASEASSWMAEFLYEEMADACLSRLRQFIPRLPPVTRLRLFAFIHLLETPEALGANLSCEAPGALRLTLMTKSGRNASLPE